MVNIDRFIDILNRNAIKLEESDDEEKEEELDEDWDPKTKSYKTTQEMKDFIFVVRNALIA